MSDKAAGELYNKIGLGTRVGFGKKPAILNIDVQKAFTLEGEIPTGCDLADEIAHINVLVAEARKKKVPIFHTYVAYSPTGLDAGWWGIKLGGALSQVTYDSRWAELDDRLEVQEDDYVMLKKMASAFHNTDLQSMLTFLGVDTCIITGDSTSGCVRATAVDSISHGFRTVVPLDCVGDRAEGPHQAAIFDMNSKYADVVRLSEVLEYIRSLPEAEV